MPIPDEHAHPPEVVPPLNAVPPDAVPPDAVPPNAAPPDPAADPHAATAVRLEALGLLAGGVAHDFNNILAVIRANVELARGALGDRPADVPMALSDLAEVDRAVVRASELVRQLLAFGRRQRLAPEPLDLNAVVRETLALMRVLVGDAVQVVIRPAPDLPRVRADRPQMEQVLVSLVLNGRDAIAEVVARAGTAASDAAAVDAPAVDAPARPGTLTVATRTAHLAADDVAQLGVPRPGRYACLEVRDDGVGMDAATRARIFEPFFTTKAVDRGAGLGLAATWGIVRQSGGVIHVASEPGAGSTFTVYLPATDAVPAEIPAFERDAVPEVATSAPAAAASLDLPDVPSGAPVEAWHDSAGTVLLAEDDHAVRRATSRILRGAGYQVLEAGDGRSALALWRARASEVAVLVADIRMPYLRGDALARAVRAERPDLPVVLTTGFGGEPSVHDGAEAAEAAATPNGAPNAGAIAHPLDVPVLGKPFTAAELLGHVAASLAAARGGR